MADKKKFGTKRLQSDLDRKQGEIGFVTSAINTEEMGMGDLKFTSLTAHQLDANDPAQDEGRLYIRDKSGVLFYITATRVG